jgi:hypothetical protein
MGDRHRWPVYRVLQSVGGGVLLAIAVLAFIRGDLIPAILTTLLGVLALGGPWYQERSRATPSDVQPDNRTLVTMILVWLAAGIVTLVIGIMAGGLLLVVCIVGFTASIYLVIGLSVAVVRRR